jgi:hypothetical protein
VIDWFFDLLQHVSTACLFAVLVTFVLTTGTYAIWFWRAIIKRHLVFGFVHEPIAKRGEYFEHGYFRVVEAGRGFESITTAALNSLEAAE